MTAADLLDQLRRADIRVWVEGGQLRASAPPGALTDELRENLKTNRDTLRALLAADSAEPAVTPVTRGPGRTFPLSFTQQRLWMLQVLNPDDTAYHVIQADRIRGPLNVEALAGAWAAVTKRHEMLRTRVVTIAGEPALAVDDAPTPVVERRDLDLSAGDTAIERLIHGEAMRPFDLERGPLASLLIARVALDDHVVIMRLHHIVADQWSLGILREDLFACYREAADGIPANLPDLPVQYVDYASWQRQLDQSAGWQADRDYWQRTLADAVPIELPSMAAKTDGQPEGSRVCFPLPATLVKDLTALATKTGSTLFMTFIAGFAAILARYTGQDDVTIGTPVAGRQRAEFERLVGPFINTLALRIAVANGASFLDLLQHVKDVTLEAQGHRDLPFEQVVALTSPARRAGHAPLVQVMFNLLNTIPAGIDLPGLQRESLSVDRQASALDLTLIADMSDNTLTGEFRLDVISDAGVRQLISHLLRLLETAVAAPTRPVASIPIVDDQEREWLQRINDVKVPTPDEPSIVNRVRARTTESPEALAVIGTDDRLTYAELVRRSGRLAAQLRAAGVGPDVLVGVSLQRSSCIAVALLAVLEAGGAYLPIDPALPAARRAWLVEDGRPQLILADATGAAALGDAGVPVLRVDRRLPGDDAAESPRIEEQAGPEHLAYVLYTSGSTGYPKGVEISRESLTNLLDAMASRPGMDSGDVLVAVTTLSFDIATLEILLPLVVGATLVIATLDEATDGSALLALTRECGATIMQGTPATWRMLLEAGWDGAPALKVLCGGEALAPDLAERLVERGSSVWNLYGPTETTIWSTVDQVTAHDAVTIGRPVDNTSVYVLDSSADLAPIGVPGELYIGGLGVARGYRGKPDLTTSRFIDDPFAGRSGARMYRTGDRARYRPDGRVDYLGRVDQQLKLRGFRIEPAEIESVLEDHDRVQQAVAVLRQDEGEPMLAAYVTAQPQADVGEEDLRSHLRARLPAYMVPARVVVLDQLPLTPSGKVDRRALPPPAAATAAEHDETNVPATATELSLMPIWRAVLKVRQVHRRDDFFAAGGHSLLAMRLVAQVAESLGVTLPPGAIFESPVFEDLAKLIDERRQAGEAKPWSIVRLGGASAGGTPFFWFHGIGGEVFSYVEVSKHLARSRPVYGVAADWSAAQRAEPVTVKQMAAAYVRKVVSLNPSGPYLLGGYCAGALLAVEVARLLQERGGRVALVVVVDYRLDMGLRPGWVRRVLDFVKNSPRWILQDALPSGPRDMAGRIRSGFRRVRARLFAPLGPQTLSIQDRLGVWRFPASQAAMLLAHSEAFGSYAVPELHANLALVLPEAAPLFGPWPSGGDRYWQERSGNRVHIYPVRGSHSTMLREPFATALAERIELSIDEALAAEPTQTEYSAARSAAS